MFPDGDYSQLPWRHVEQTSARVFASDKRKLMDRESLAVPIIYMLLRSEYNYGHSLELIKVPRWLISEKTIF